LRGGFCVAAPYGRSALCSCRRPVALVYHGPGTPLNTGCRSVLACRCGCAIRGATRGIARATYRIRSRSCGPCTCRRRSRLTRPVGAVWAHRFTCAVCPGCFGITAGGCTYIPAIARPRSCRPAIGCPVGGARRCCIGYPCGARRRAAVTVYLRTVEAYRATVYSSPARPRSTAYFPYGHAAAGSPFNLAPAWAAYVRTVVVHVRVVDNGSTVVYPHAIAVRCIVTVQSWAGNVPLGHEYPMVVGDADVHINAHARAKRRPTVVTTATPPAHPGRSPFVTRYPGPAVVIGIRPAAVVEWSPPPVVIRHPGVTVAGHHPVAVGGIRLKALFRIRKPYISIFRVIYPLPVRCQFVVK